MDVANSAGRRVKSRSSEQPLASEIVREAIRDSGLPIRELARRTGVEPSVLSRFMNGQVGIGLTTFELLAAELGLRVVRAKKQRRVARRWRREGVCQMKNLLGFTAAEILRLEYGDSKNSLTPTVLSRVLVGPGVAAELSEGRGRNDQPIFGVTVAVMNPDGTTYPAGREGQIRSAVFSSREAAEAHVTTMADYLLKEKPPEGRLFWRDIPGVPMAGLVPIDKLPTQEEFEKKFGHLRQAIKPGFSKKGKE